MRTSQLDPDPQALAKNARACARLLARRSRSPLTGRRFSRAAGLVALRLGIWFRRLLRDHWDIGVFDVAFGSLKAFLVYPAAFRAGLAWTIPLLEYVPLNTQLWTAGYLLLRRRLVSRLGVWRHGVELDRLDALRAAAMGSSGPGFAHVFEHEGARFELRVAGGWLQAAWRRLRGLREEPGQMSLAALRRCVPRRFVYEARALRVHDLLYERTLIERALRDRDAALRLVARAGPAPPQCAPWGGLVKACHSATRARVRWLADRHATATRAHFPSLSRSGLALRWLGGSYQRCALRRVAEIEALEYGLLAALHRGEPWQQAPEARGLRLARRRLDDVRERFAAFASRSRALRSARAPAEEREALQRVRQELGRARRLGLAAPLARLAADPLPTRRAALA